MNAPTDAHAGPAAVGPHGLVPHDASGVFARADKPRGSLADVVAARRDCLPCRAESATSKAEAFLARSKGPLPPEAERLLSAATAKPYEDKGLGWLRRWALAGSDPLADVLRYTTPPAPEPQAVPIFGWMHVAVMGDVWETILREQLSAVERSGLLAATSRILMGVVGPDADLLWLPDWVTVVRRDGPIGMGENSTLEEMWAWSKTVGPSKLWYVHTKGASHNRGNPCVTEWVDYLMDYTVLRWREASEVLDGPYDCCGCDLTRRDDEWFRGIGGNSGPGFQLGHGFEGNFWWAKSKYVANLPPDRVSLNRTRWDAEWSFVGAGFPRAKELHGPHEDRYKVPYPRSRYEAPHPARDEAVAYAGDGVFLTKASSCGANLGSFPRSIHIWKPSDLKDNCGRAKAGLGPGLAVRYSEGAPIASMDPPLAEVAAYLAGHGDVLIHCVAGHYRAPVLAALAKAVRGCDPSAACDQVERSNLSVRGLPKPIDPLNRREIIEFAATFRPPTAPARQG